MDPFDSLSSTLAGTSTIGSSTVIRDYHTLTTAWRIQPCLCHAYWPNSIYLGSIPHFRLSPVDSSSTQRPELPAPRRSRQRGLPDHTGSIMSAAYLWRTCMLQADKYPRSTSSNLSKATVPRTCVGPIRGRSWEAGLDRTCKWHQQQNM